MTPLDRMLLLGRMGHTVLLQKVELLFGISNTLIWSTCLSILCHHQAPLGMIEDQVSGQWHYVTSQGQDGDSKPVQADQRQDLEIVNGDDF